MGQTVGGQIGGRSIAFWHNGCIRPFTHWQMQSALVCEVSVIVKIIAAKIFIGMLTCDHQRFTASAGHLQPYHLEIVLNHHRGAAALDQVQHRSSHEARRNAGQGGARRRRCAHPDYACYLRRRSLASSASTLILNSNLRSSGICANNAKRCKTRRVISPGSKAKQMSREIAFPNSHNVRSM